MILNKSSFLSDGSRDKTDIEVQLTEHRFGIIVSGSFTKGETAKARRRVCVPMQGETEISINKLVTYSIRWAQEKARDRDKLSREGRDMETMFGMVSFQRVEMSRDLAN